MAYIKEFFISATAYQVRPNNLLLLFSLVSCRLNPTTSPCIILIEYFYPWREGSVSSLAQQSLDYRWWIEYTATAMGHLDPYQIQLKGLLWRIRISMTGFQVEHALYIGTQYCFIGNHIGDEE